MGHIQIRISDEEKKAAEKVLKKMGLNYSMAIKLFLRHVVKTKQLPFQVGVGAGPAMAAFVEPEPSHLWQGEKVSVKNSVIEKSKSAAAVIPEIEPEISAEKLVDMTVNSLVDSSESSLSMVDTKSVEEDKEVVDTKPKKTWSPFQKHRIG